MAISGTFTSGDEVTFKDCKVEVDLTPSSSSFAGIDSWATEVAVSGGDTPITQVYPFTSDVIVLPGNRTPYTVTVTVLYTEGSTDPFKNINDHYNNGPGDAFDVQWSPLGSGEGGYLFTTSGGKLTNVTLPQGSGDAATPTTFQFTVQCSSITQGTES